MIPPLLPVPCQEPLSKRTPGQALSRRGQRNATAVADDRSHRGAIGRTGIGGEKVPFGNRGERSAAKGARATGRPAWAEVRSERVKANNDRAKIVDFMSDITPTKNEWDVHQKTREARGPGEQVASPRPGRAWPRCPAHGAKALLSVLKKPVGRPWRPFQRARQTELPHTVKLVAWLAEVPLENQPARQTTVDILASYRQFAI